MIRRVAKKGGQRGDQRDLRKEVAAISSDPRSAQPDPKREPP